MAISSVWMLLLVIFIMAMVLNTLPYCNGLENDDYDDDDEYQQPTSSVGYSYVTCGSVIKLSHVATGYKLHSHEVKYGSGSGQQSVTAFPTSGDSNSHFKVKESHSSSRPCRPSSRIKNGATIRLQHTNTGRNVHSHHHNSPLSHNLEVSAFGDDGMGDAGDNWIVETKNGEKFWQRNKPIRLRHEQTGFYMYSDMKYKFQRPIVGQLEVCGLQSTSFTNQHHWKAEEGVYLKYVPLEKSSATSP